MGTTNTPVHQIRKGDFLASGATTERAAPGGVDDVDASDAADDGLKEKKSHFKTRRIRFHKVKLAET